MKNKKYWINKLAWFAYLIEEASNGTFKFELYYGVAFSKFIGILKNYQNWKPIYTFKYGKKRKINYKAELISIAKAFGYETTLRYAFRNVYLPEAWKGYSHA